MSGAPGEGLELLNITLQGKGGHLKKHPYPQASCLGSSTLCRPGGSSQAPSASALCRGAEQFLQQPEPPAATPLRVCFGKPPRERPRAKECDELSANCSIGLLALVKNLYLSGEFQFPATGSCSACACQIKELSNNQHLCSIIYAAAVIHTPPSRAHGPGAASAAGPSWARGGSIAAPQTPDTGHRPAHQLCSKHPTPSARNKPSCSRAGHGPARAEHPHPPGVSAQPHPSHRICTLQPPAADP